MSTFREKNLRVLGAVGAAVAVLLLAGGLEFAKLPFSTHYDYHADLSEAGQIQGGEEVTVAGVKVGTTQGMTLVIHPGGSYVRLNFELDRRLEMGTGTTLAVKVLSPLGQEYVQLAPAGSGQLKPGSTIPLAHTSVSGTLADTLGQLGQTVGAINTNQLSQALQVLNGDLSATAPAATQSLIDGLGRLSTVINDNQSQIDQLVRAANQVVTTLNGHKVQLLSLIGQSNLILQVVSQRQADLSALLSSTRSLASHLSSIMDSKTSNLGTLLSELNTVSGVLARNSSNLQQIVPLAAALARYGANATGNGPYVDAITPLPFIDDEDVAACGLPGAFVTGLDGTSCQLGTNGLPSGGLVVTSMAPIRTWLHGHLIPTVALAIAVTVVGAVLGVLLTSSPTGERTITAVFAEAPGLYTGNQVDVLGMPVGTITAVEPTGADVVVKMRLPMHYPIPANASAVLEAPEVVNDRYVQLQPAWSGGPVMGQTATIPLTRTLEPLSTEQILGSLDTLLKALGPVAADPNGVLGTLVSTLDKEIGGQGAAINSTIDSTSAAVGTIAQNAPQLVLTLNQLGSFLKTAASDTGTYTQLTGNLATASADLSSDRTELSQALDQLGVTLSDVTKFVQANATSLKGSLDNLEQATAAVAANQKALAQTIQVMPLLEENTQMALASTAQGNAINGRVDSSPASQQVVSEMCGKTLTQTVRALQIFTEQSNAPKWDLLCMFGGALASYKAPPGVPTGSPDVSIASIYAYKNQ